MKRLLSALIVFVLASTITGLLGTWLSSSYGDSFDQTILIAVFAILWFLLMFIGFRVSQRFLRDTTQPTREPR